MKHLSPSAANMYRKCGESYRLRYIEGLRRPPGGALLVGGAVHAGAEYRNRRMMLSHVETSKRYIVDASVSAYDERLKKEDISLDGEEENKGRGQIVASYRDATATFASGYVDHVAPAIKRPIAVEERIELVVPKLGITLLGILDVAHEDNGRVVLEDLKVGRKAWTVGDADLSDQLTWYAMAWKHTHGALPYSVGIRSLRTLSAGPTAMFRQSFRSNSHVDKLLATIETVLSGIRAGVFIPAAEGAWWCSRRWCGYWHDCRYRGKQ